MWERSADLALVRAHLLDRATWNGSRADGCSRWGSDGLAVMRAGQEGAMGDVGAS